MGCGVSATLRTHSSNRALTVGALSPSPSSSCHPGLLISASGTVSGTPWCGIPRGAECLQGSGCPVSAGSPGDGGGCPGTGCPVWQSPVPGDKGTQEEEEEDGARAARVFSFVASWLAGCSWREITEWESVGCAAGGRGHRHGTGHPRGTGHPDGVASPAEAGADVMERHVMPPG